MSDHPYEEVYRLLGLPPLAVALGHGQIRLPEYDDLTFPCDRFYGFPPALVPLWCGPGLKHIGYWQHFFIDRQSTIVTVYVEGRNRASESARSVEQLVHLIEAADDGADEIRVDYDPTFGFPSSVNIDYEERAIDDELGFRITDFRVGP